MFRLLDNVAAERINHELVFDIVRYLCPGCGADGGNRHAGNDFSPSFEKLAASPRMRFTIWGCSSTVSKQFLNSSPR